MGKKYTVPKELREQVRMRDNGRCRLCGLDDWESLDADHVIPESMGGETTLENLQAVCKVCNSHYKGAIKLPNFPIRPALDTAISHFEYKAEVAANREALRVLVESIRGQVKVERESEWVTIETMVMEWKANGDRKLTIRKRLQKLINNQSKIQELLDK